MTGRGRRRPSSTAASSVNAGGGGADIRGGSATVASPAGARSMVAAEATGCGPAAGTQSASRLPAWLSAAVVVGFRRWHSITRRIRVVEREHVVVANDSRDPDTTRTVESG